MPQLIAVQRSTGIGDWMAVVQSIHLHLINCIAEPSPESLVQHDAKIERKTKNPKKGIFDLTQTAHQKPSDKVNCTVAVPSVCGHPINFIAESSPGKFQALQLGQVQTERLVNILKTST